MIRLTLVLFGPARAANKRISQKGDGFATLNPSYALMAPAG
jgi:hypothetical protein